MEEVKTNAGQGLGIAGLVMGILAIPLAILGCTSPLGLAIGVAGIILSAVGLSQAIKSNGNKGLSIGGLSVSVTGTFIALLWLVFFAHLGTDGLHWWNMGGKRIINEISEDFQHDMEGIMDDMEENFEQTGEDLEERLEDLEWEEKWENFEWGEEISDEEFEKVLDAYENLIKDYADLVEKAGEGNIAALAEYAKVSARAVALASKITAAGPRLSEEQMEQFKKLQQKYEEELEKSKENTGEE